MKDYPTRSLEFEVARRLRRRDRRRWLLHQKEAELFGLKQQLTLTQRVAYRLEHPSVENLTWLQLRALKLCDEIDTLCKKLNV
jgi:hypothetical protein